MREIKFRAWDSKRNEMVYFDLNLCNDESRSWYLQQIDGNEIMQLTGLLDKNGVDIYEGDIIEDELGNIEAIEWNSIVARFQLGRKYTFTPLGKYEVIGNIYENKEI